MNQLLGPFDDPPVALRLRALAPLSVMLGSLVTIFPFIAGFPVLPPVGLLLLLAWRLHRPDALPVWSPLLLGLFDDLIGGQPIGSGMFLWTTCFFAIDLIERRLIMLRSFWQDWLVAAGGIATCLILGRLIATPFAADVDTALLVQIAVSILLFPFAAQLAAWLAAKPDAL